MMGRRSTQQLECVIGSLVNGGLLIKLDYHSVIAGH